MAATQVCGLSSAALQAPDQGAGSEAKSGGCTGTAHRAQPPCTLTDTTGIHICLFIRKGFENKLVERQNLRIDLGKSTHAHSAEAQTGLQRQNSKITPDLKMPNNTRKVIPFSLRNKSVPEFKDLEPFTSAKLISSTYPLQILCKTHIFKS